MKLKRGWNKSIALLFYCFIVFCGAFFLSAKISHADSGDHLVINEIYPHSNEEYLDDQGRQIGVFIELLNVSGEPFSTNGCTIKDATDKPKMLKNTILNPNEYYTLYKADADFSFALNFASKETVTLTCGAENDTLKYSSEDKDWPEYIKYEDGKSISRVPDGEDTGVNSSDFQLVDPTPELNTFIEIVEADSSNDPIDIISAREELNGTAVTITGTVTVLPGTLSLQYFYIQDATGGMQIYSYYKNFPELQIGDTIQVTGELSETSGERRLKMNAETIITVLSHETPPPPKPVEIADIGEKLEGQYVKISGTVAETSGDTFIVADNAGHSIKVVIKSMTNIDKPKMKKGDQVEVMGIVSQYKDDYRILPIDQDDVKIISSKGNALAETGMPLLLYPVFSFIIMLLWNTFQKVKMRLIKLRRGYLQNLLLAIFMR